MKNRLITLMIYTNDYDDKIIQELKDFCEKENIIFKEGNIREKYIYDFVIEGRTVDYNKIKEKFSDKIRETYYAELGNVLDLDSESFDKLQKMFSGFNKVRFEKEKLHDEFFKLIINEEDLNKLQILKNYTLDNHCKSLIDTKISVVKNEKCEWELYMETLAETQKMIDFLKEIKENKKSLTEEHLQSVIDLFEKLKTI